MRRDIIITTAVFAAFALLYGTMQLMLPTSRTDSEVEVEVEHGMTFRAATMRIVDSGLIRDPNLFVAMGRLSGLHTRLRPGTYTFSGRQSPWSVFSTLRAGRSRLWQVTVTEGENLWRIGEKLSAEGLMGKEVFLNLASDPELLSTFNIKAPSLEGYIFPDTYLFSKGMRPERIIRVMVSRMRSVTGPLMDRAAERGMSERELLTMASIVGTEAQLDAERPIIAAVYLNRLRIGMRLQADPTVVYGIKHMSEGITRSDLARRTPYNTYVIRGMPPGPIASPGAGSIRAVLYPAEVPYLYFVSNNDGSHIFTSTLRDHQRAVKAYRTGRSLKSRKKDNDR